MYIPTAADFHELGMFLVSLFVACPILAVLISALASAHERRH